MTQRIASKYAIIRFRPYVETGEFANVGIVLMAPSAQYFGFKVLKNRHARITGFFQELEAKTFRESMKYVDAELARVSALLKSYAFDRRRKFTGNHEQTAELLFEEIVRPRETAVLMSEVRVVLADDPKRKVEELFSYYVERNFVTKKYRETVLETELKHSLRKSQLLQCYEKRKLGDHDFSVSIPFTEMNVAKPRLIKPLSLGQETATKILEHSNSWHFRIAELKRRDFIDVDKVLFATEGPGDGQLGKTYRESQEMLAELGVHVVNFDQKEEILEFAAL